MESYFLLFYGMFPVFYAVNIYILESMIHTDLWEYVTFVGKNLMNNKNCTLSFFISLQTTCATPTFTNQKSILCKGCGGYHWQ